MSKSIIFPTVRDVVSNCSAIDNWGADSNVAHVAGCGECAGTVRRRCEYKINKLHEASSYTEAPTDLIMDACQEKYPQD